tara:strand:- start:211 stop:441 length:231 start_codon:yes stop_codon:yes gene_type:complete
MLDSFKRLVVDKDEIVSEETKTVKMLVPMSFELVDGKCANEADQELYDFLAERDDVDLEDVRLNTENTMEEYIEGQ